MATRNYGTGTTAKTILLAPTNPQDNAKTGLAFVKRTLGVGNKIIPPIGGTPMPNLYVPFKLPAYSSATDAIADLVKMGYKYVGGISRTETLIAPDAININTSTGITSLIWNSAALGLQGYANASAVTGVITQDTTAPKPTANLLSITVQNGITTLQCVLVNSSPIFNLTDPLTIDINIKSIVPDETKSDNVVVATYAYYDQYVTSPKNDTSPDLWLSVIPSTNGDINPDPTPIPLAAPTDVTDLGGGAYNLTYPIDANQLGLLPTTYLGNTIVTQGSITATYQGYEIIGAQVIISVTAATGEITKGPLTVTLDFSQSGFQYLGNEEISSFALGYANVPTQQKLETDYPVFVAGIAALQSKEVTKKRKYKVKGYYGFAFQSIGQYQTVALTTPDTEMYKASIVFDVNTKFQVATQGYNVAMKSMFMDLNGDYPFYENSGEGVIINIPASDNPASWVTDDVINQAASQGWTVFAPSKSTGLHYVYRNVCTLQTVSSREDAEYRYMSFQLKLRYYVKNSVEIAETTCTNPDGTRKNNNPGLITQLKTNLESLQSTLQNKAQIAGFESILGANCSVSVTLKPSDVTRTLIQEKISIVSGNGGNDIEIYVEPYTI